MTKANVDASRSNIEDAQIIELYPSKICQSNIAETLQPEAASLYNTCGESLEFIDSAFSSTPSLKIMSPMLNCAISANGSITGMAGNININTMVPPVISEVLPPTTAITAATMSESIHRVALKNISIISSAESIQTLLPPAIILSEDTAVATAKNLESVYSSPIEIASSAQKVVENPLDSNAISIHFKYVA